MSEYDDYEYELKKEGVSEERTDGAYISVKYYHLDGGGGGGDCDGDFDGASFYSFLAKIK